MANTITRSFSPTGFTPGSSITVSLTVVIDTSLTATYIAEDIYPVGWGPTSSVDPVGGNDNGISVRWFFLDNANRVLSYDIDTPLVPVTTTTPGGVVFGGSIDSDGPGGFQSVPTAGEGTTGSPLLPLVAEPHPADTSANFAIVSSEVLAYAAAFLADNDGVFPGISPPNRSAYVLRAAAIFLGGPGASLGKYEDQGTVEPVDSTLHPARWQGIPD